MKVTLAFVLWLEANYNVDVYAGNYGTFAYIDDIDIWKKQHGGGYQLSDTSLAKRLVNKWLESLS